MNTADRRAWILEAAGRAITARGIGGFTIRDVAELAEVSQPLVSSHFRSRQELIQHAFLQADERARAASSARTASAATALDALRAQTVLWLDERADSSIALAARLWLEVWSHGTVITELHEIVASHQRDRQTHIEELIGEGIRDGSIRADADPAAVALLLAVITDGLGPSVMQGILGLRAATEVVDQTLRHHLIDPCISRRSEACQTPQI